MLITMCITGLALAYMAAIASAGPPPSPTIAPTRVPTITPTRVPTPSPTIAPTRVPTPSPTIAPTRVPTPSPTIAPTRVPTKQPTGQPTSKPTGVFLYSPYLSSKCPTSKTPREGFFFNFAILLPLSFFVVLAEIYFFANLHKRGQYYSSHAKKLSDSSYNKLKELSYYKKQSRTAEDSHSGGRIHNFCSCRRFCCCCCCCFERFCQNHFSEPTPEEYGPHYFSILVHKGAFMYCSDIWLPRGEVGWFRFPRGMVEDFIMYLFNNHTILSLFLSVRGHPYGKWERLFAFFVQYSVVFCESCAFLSISATDRFRYKLVSAPSALISRQIIYLLLGCQCIAEHERAGYIYARVLACCGGSLAVHVFFEAAILNIVLGAFLGAMYYSYCFNDFLGDGILDTTISMFIVAPLLDLLFCALRFLNGRVAVEITLCCCCTYKGIGRWFGDKILYFGLEKGSDYGELSVNLLLLKFLIRWERNGSADRTVPNHGGALNDDGTPVEYTSNPLARRPAPAYTAAGLEAQPAVHAKSSMEPLTIDMHAAADDKYVLTL